MFLFQDALKIPNLPNINFIAWVIFFLLNLFIKMSRINNGIEKSLDNLKTDGPPLPQ